MEERRIIEEILTETAAFYHKNLTKQSKEYLVNDRGFTEEIINQFKLGFARGGLREHLICKYEFSQDLYLKAGVLRSAGDKGVKDYFNNRIIFPNLRRGRVVYLTGRVLNDDKSKYLNIPGEICHLYNEDALMNDEVILVEGAPDCLTLIQNGFNAVGLLGASGFKPEFIEKFLKVRIVYICFDGDDPGRSGAFEIGSMLADKAIIVDLPEGSDINEYFKSRSSKEFQALLNAGRTYFDIAIEKIKAFPSNIQPDKLTEFLPKLACLKDFKRNRYIDIFKKEFGLSKSTISSGINAKKTNQDEPQITSDDQLNKPSLTESEKEEAIELLKDPGLLERLIETTEKFGCVGEENNRIVIYITLLSRILDNPISLIVKGDSSGGKSFLVEAICQLFPSDELLVFTTLTPKALYHRPNDLSHKALVIFERSGSEEGDYSIRSLQSEKKLVISMPVKNEKTGRFETIDHEIKGPVAFIETTTQTHLHPENETRCFDIFVDDSEEQTIRIHEMQRKKYGGGEASKENGLRPWKVTQNLLKPYQVLIPYIDLIKFPSKPLRVRRDFPRFMSIIEISAILHQYQREKKIIDGVEYLVADIEDYAIAYSLGATILTQTIKQISPKAEKLIQMIQKHIDAADEGQFKRREVTDFTKWDLKTVKKYLDECMDLGLIDVKEGGRGVAYQYTFVKLPDAFDNLLLHPDRLREAFKSINLSKKGKVIQSALGSVNELDDSQLDQVNQANNKNKGMKVVFPKQDLESDINQPSIQGGLDG
jgi:DNA primase